MKCVVSNDVYMCEEYGMSIYEGKDLIDILGQVFISKEVIEEDDGVPMSDYEYMESCKDANGDGQPYYVFFDLEKEEVVFG